MSIGIPPFLRLSERPSALRDKSGSLQNLDIAMRILVIRETVRRAAAVQCRFAILVTFWPICKETHDVGKRMLVAANGQPAHLTRNQIFESGDLRSADSILVLQDKAQGVTAFAADPVTRTINTSMRFPFPQ
jgi:hypothetical protein